MYRLTLVGTARATWDYAGPPTTTADCSSTEAARGVRVVRFRMSRPVLVRLVGGRLTPTAIRDLSGRVSVLGQNTLEQTCAGVATRSPQPCPVAAYTFRDGGAVVFSPGPRMLAFKDVRTVLQHSECPDAPTGVLPLGPVPSFRIPRSALEPQIARITTTASAARRTTYGPPEAGKLVQRSSWRLTLIRARP